MEKQQQQRTEPIVQNKNPRRRTERHCTSNSSRPGEVGVLQRTVCIQVTAGVRQKIEPGKPPSSLVSHGLKVCSCGATRPSRRKQRFEKSLTPYETKMYESMIAMVSPSYYVHPAGDALKSSLRIHWLETTGGVCRSREEPWTCWWTHEHLAPWWSNTGSMYDQFLGDITPWQGDIL